MFSVLAHDPLTRGSLVHEVQYRLLTRGIPVAWTVDVPLTDPLFVPVQMLAAAGAIPESGPRSESLELQLDGDLDEADRSALAQALEVLGLTGTGVRERVQAHKLATWRTVCTAVSDELFSRFTRYL